MFDDPGWGDDPRDRADHSRDLTRGSRGGSDPRERERVDPRDVFMERVNLPRGMEREHVLLRDREYTSSVDPSMCECPSLAATDGLHEVALDRRGQNTKLVWFDARRLRSPS